MKLAARLPRSGNFYFTLLVMLFLLLLVGTAWSYSHKAALVPLVIGIPTAVLALVELVRDRSPALARLLETRYLSSKKEKESARAEQTTKTIGRELTALLLIVGYVALIMIVGFHIAIPLFVIYYCLVYARAPWWKALVLAAGTWGFIYLVFCIFLEVHFPWGMVF